MNITKNIIENTVIYNDIYDVTGKWECEGDKLYLKFEYDDQQFKIHFKGIFNETTYIWLIDIAYMMITSEVEEYEFNKINISGESLWD